MSSLIHDPNAHLDYRWDWSQWLAEGEIIQSATVTAPEGGLSIGAPTVTNDAVVVWISGGVAPSAARVTCHIVTNEGRQDDRSMKLSIKER